MAASYASVGFLQLPLRVELSPVGLPPVDAVLNVVRLGYLRNGNLALLPGAVHHGGRLWPRTLLLVEQLDIACLLHQVFFLRRTHHWLGMLWGALPGYLENLLRSRRPQGIFGDRSVLRCNLRQGTRAQNCLLELFELHYILAEDIQQVLCRLRRLRYCQIHGRDLVRQSETGELLELGDHILRFDTRLQRDECLIDY